LGLSGGGGGLRQGLLIRHHIDKRRLPNITPANEGVFRPVRCGTLSVVGITDQVFGIGDLHEAQDNEEWQLGLKG
jgi:hypothetical protein